MPKRITAKLKLKVYRRDNFCCVYCGSYPTQDNNLTIDHVVPIKFGGTKALSNLATCCQKCNSLKGSMLLTQFIKAYDIIITKEIDKYL